MIFATAVLIAVTPQHATVQHKKSIAHRAAIAHKKASSHKKATPNSKAPHDSITAGDGIGHPGVSDVPLHDLNCNKPDAAAGTVSGVFFLGQTEKLGSPIQAQVFVASTIDVNQGFRPTLVSDKTAIWRNINATCKVIDPKNNVGGAEVSFSGSFPLADPSQFWVAVELYGDDPEAPGHKETSLVANKFDQFASTAPPGQEGELGFKPFGLYFSIEQRGAFGNGDDVIPISLVRPWSSFDNNEHHSVYTNQPNQPLSCQMFTNEDPDTLPSITLVWSPASDPGTDSSTSRKHAVHHGKKPSGAGFVAHEHTLYFTDGPPPGTLRYKEWSGVLRSSNHP